jgi:Zn-dependent peptidase ImmA (M78 family)
MLPAYKDTSKDESFTDGSKHFRRDGSISPVEREANKFSADLLMPADMLAREAKELADSHRAPSGKVAMSKSDFIELLADKFQVSNQAMEYRLKNLRII